MVRTNKVSEPPTILSPSPSLSLFTSIVVSFPGFTSQVAGSAGGSSGFLTKEPVERSEPLEREEAGPPCCLSTALPGCCCGWWWWRRPPASWIGPVAEFLNPAADGNKEEVEEVELGEREGRGSTGVAADEDIDGEARVSPPRAVTSSDDVDEMDVGVMPLPIDRLVPMVEIWSGD